MTREEIHNEIGNLLKLIEINNNRMFLNEANLELDLEQMRNHVLRLYTLHDQLTLASLTQEEVNHKTSNQPVTDEPVPDVEEEPEVVDEPEVVEPVVEEVVVTPKAKKVKAKFKPEPVAQEVEPTPPIVKEVVKVEPEPQVVLEEEEAPPPAKPKRKLAQKPAKTQKGTPVNDVYKRLKNSKITSIKKGISISKRYEIQNQLFDNDPEVYNKSIQTLDTAEDLDHAMKYLVNNLVVEHDWDEESSLVEEIKTLLERRYM